MAAAVAEGGEANGDHAAMRRGSGKGSGIGGRLEHDGGLGCRSASSTPLARSSSAIEGLLEGRRTDPAPGGEEVFAVDAVAQDRWR